MIVDALDLAQGTAYTDVNRLIDADIVEVTRDKQPGRIPPRENRPVRCSRFEALSVEMVYKFGRELVKLLEVPIEVVSSVICANDPMVSETLEDSVDGGAVVVALFDYLGDCSWLVKYSHPSSKSGVFRLQRELCSRYAPKGEAFSSTSRNKAPRGPCQSTTRKSRCGSAGGRDRDRPQRHGRTIVATEAIYS